MLLCVRFNEENNVNDIVKYEKLNSTKVMQILLIQIQTQIQARTYM